MEIPIIFENNDILVLNKPAGVMVHADGKTNQQTVADWLVQHYPEQRSVGEAWHAKLPREDFPRAGIAHRLDKDTSGCLLVAKNQASFEYLKQQFKDRSIHKQYHALVYGHVKEDEGVIEQPIGRSAKDFRMWSAQRGARGRMREALTEYRVIKRFESHGELFTLLALFPRTGRTHQIRVHLKYINHPIVADTLYAGKRVSQSHNFGLKRQALHARALRFCDQEGKEISVEAPYPQDFVEIEQM